MAKSWTNRGLEECFRAYLSSLNSSSGSGVRDYSNADIAAGMFLYIALCDGKFRNILCSD